MAIRFFSAKDFSKVLKVTIQKTGRLGFTKQTEVSMNIDENAYFRFGKDEQLEADLIIVKVKEPSDDCFRAIKSGEYYYLNTTALFDMLDYNYKKEPIIFDVRRQSSLDEEAGGEAYLLTRRAPKSRRSSTKTNTKTSPDLFDNLSEE